jgi:acyl-CoA hydrolase
MQGKTVSETAVTTSHIMYPQDTNPAGNVQGGVIVRLLDITAGVVAIRHTQSNVVTASIDRVDFHSPVFPGDLVTFKASLNYVGKTSMEVGVRVETETVMTGYTRHTATAYVTMVALDKAGKPLEVPPLILQTDEDRRRNHDAQARRAIRLQEREKRNAA